MKPQTGDQPQAARPSVLELLEKVRSERKPTRRGLILCAAAMGEMLRLGWHKDQLDALEMTWWLVHNGNGELIVRGSGVGTDAGQTASPSPKTSAAALPVSRDAEEEGKRTSPNGTTRTAQGE